MQERENVRELREHYVTLSNASRKVGKLLHDQFRKTGLISNRHRMIMW